MEGLIAHRKAQHPDNTTAYPIRCCFIEKALPISRLINKTAVRLFRLAQEEALHLLGAEGIERVEDAKKAEAHDLNILRDHTLSELEVSSPISHNEDNNEDSAEDIDLTGAFSPERRNFTYWSNQQLLKAATQSIHGFTHRLTFSYLESIKSCSGYPGSECLTLSIVYPAIPMNSTKSYARLTDVTIPSSLGT